MEKILGKCNKIAYVLLCILMCDCCMFSSTNFVEIGMLDHRMILIILLLLFSIPTLLSKFKNIVRNKYFITIILFAIWIVIATVIGLINHNRVSLIITDIKGFMYFIILPVAIALLDNHERIHRLMKIMMYASFIAAIYVMIMLTLYITQPEFYDTINPILTVLNISKFPDTTVGIPRMFYTSVMYLLCACGISVYLDVKENKERMSFKYILITSIALFALFMTFTRSIYLGALVAAVGVVASIFIVTGKNVRLRLGKYVACVVAIFLMLTSVYSIAADMNYLKFAIMRSTVSITKSENEVIGTESEITENLESDTQTEEIELIVTETTDIDVSTENVDTDVQKEYIELTQTSDQARNLTLQGLYRNIAKSPIIGLGLGAEFEERPDGLNEYFYLDLWSKAGIVGLLLYLAPIFYMIRTIIINRKSFNLNNISVLILLSILIGFMTFSFFNPYMNAAPGILFYCIVMGVFSEFEGREKLESKG